MMERKNFSLTSRIRSVVCAIQGLCDMLRTEPNAWLHLVATVTILGLSFWFGLTVMEWGFIVVSIVAVWTAEAFNTVIEVMVDKISPEYSHEAKRAKDIAAAAVLITAVGASVTGLIILGPHLAAKF